MSAKYVFVLVIFYCVTQGFEARVPSYAETRVTIDENVRLLNSLNNKIDEASDKIDKLFQGNQEKIKDILSIINISDIVQEIENKFDDVISTARISTKTANSCVTEGRKALQRLISSTNEGVHKCLTTNDPLKNQIAGKVFGIRSEAASVSFGISSSTAKCFKDHGLNPSELINCLKGLLHSNLAKVFAIVSEISKEFEEVQKLIGHGELNTCINNVAEEVVQQKGDIVEKFEECIDALNEITFM